MRSITMLKERSFADWMTFGKTVLCQKDSATGIAVVNCRPISCLPLIWKLMTGMFAEKIVTQKDRMYYHLNKKDAVKAVVEQNNTYLLIKRCSETVKGDTIIQLGHGQTIKKPMTAYPIAGLVSTQKCLVLQTMYKTS